MKPLKLFPALLLATLVAALVVLANVSAQTPQPQVNTTAVSDDQVNAVASELYCPVCENIPLDVCPTQACAQWRDLIRQQLAEGKTKDEIKQYFALHYGDRVLSEPPRQGLNWLVYILPPVFFLGGVYLLYRVLRATRKVPAGSQSVASVLPPSDDPYVQRLEEELKKRNYGK
jgi:cytochrome c-type biogenesis protein CcmH